jgi:hypothetical protein
MNSNISDNMTNSIVLLSGPGSKETINWSIYLHHAVLLRVNLEHEEECKLTLTLHNFCGINTKYMQNVTCQVHTTIISG